MHTNLESAESWQGRRAPPHRVVADVLSNLHDQPDLVVGHLQRAQDGGELPLEVHIHHGTNDLRQGGAECWQRAPGGARREEPWLGLHEHRRRGPALRMIARRR